LTMRQTLVPLLSLGVMAFSALVMYTVWIFTSALSPFWHGMVSLFAWIAAFGIATAYFWRVVESLSEAKKA